MTGIVLGSAAGDSGSTICRDVGVSRPTVPYTPLYSSLKLIPDAMFSFVPTMSSGARLMPGSSKGMAALDVATGHIIICLIDRGTYPQQWFQSAAPEEQAACCRLATYLEGRIRLAYKRGRRRCHLYSQPPGVHDNPPRKYASS